MDISLIFYLYFENNRMQKNMSITMKMVH